MAVYRRKGSKLWWISYSIGGRQYRESSGTTNKRLAQELLTKRKNEIFEGRFFPDKKRGDLTMAGLRDLWLELPAAAARLKPFAITGVALCYLFMAATIVRVVGRDLRRPVASPAYED